MAPLRKPFPSRGHNTAASYERGAPQLYPAMARMCLAFRKRQTSGSSTLGRSRCLAAARSSVRWRRIPLSISPSVSASDFLSGSIRRSRLSSPLRKLANSEVHLLLAGASFTEGYTQDFHHRLMETRALRPASDLARSRLHNRLPLPKNRPPSLCGGASSSWWQVERVWVAGPSLEGG